MERDRPPSGARPTGIPPELERAVINSLHRRLRAVCPAWQPRLIAPRYTVTATVLPETNLDFRVENQHWAYSLLQPQVRKRGAWPITGLERSTKTGWVGPRRVAMDPDLVFVSVNHVTQFHAREASALVDGLAAYFLAEYNVRLEHASDADALWYRKRISQIELAYRGRRR